MIIAAVVIPILSVIFIFTGLFFIIKYYRNNNNKSSQRQDTNKANDLHKHIENQIDEGYETSSNENYTIFKKNKKNEKNEKIKLLQTLRQMYRRSDTDTVDYKELSSKITNFLKDKNIWGVKNLLDQLGITNQTYFKLAEYIRCYEWLNADDIKKIIEHFNLISSDNANLSHNVVKSKNNVVNIIPSDLLYITFETNSTDTPERFKVIGDCIRSLKDSQEWKSYSKEESVNFILNQKSSKSNYGLHWLVMRMCVVNNKIDISIYDSLYNDASKKNFLHHNLHISHNWSI
jgi:hypothetical protein